MQFPFITYVMVLCINDSIPKNTNIEQMYTCMRASELRKFWHFYILKLLFLSIFCRYMRYFVGTNDMLVGIGGDPRGTGGGGGTCTPSNFSGGIVPPPPPLDF